MLRRPGLTLIEIMVGCTIVGLLSLAVFGVGVNGARGRVRDIDAIERQQAVASALGTFSRDVRGAAGLLTPTGTSFTLRHARATGDFTYVTYRFNGDQLQRGETTVRNGTPTAWTDVFNHDQFKVASGNFSYFLLGNAAGTNALLTRRIEIANFKVVSNRTGDTVTTPVISAVMREGDNTRDLVTGCDVRIMGNWANGNHGTGHDDDERDRDKERGGGGGSSASCHNNGHSCTYGDRDDHEDGCGDDGDNWIPGDDHTCGRDRDRDGEDHSHDDEDCWNARCDTAGEIHMRSCVTNVSGAPVTIDAFSISWQDGGKGDKLAMLKLGRGRWGNGSMRLASGNTVQTMTRPVTLGAGETAPLALHFKDVPGKLDNIALELFSSADVARQASYLISLDIP